MKLKDPTMVRTLFAERKGWYTLDEISRGTGQGINTISRGLNGKSLRPATVRRIAEVLGAKPLEIAEFVS